MAAIIRRVDLEAQEEKTDDTFRILFIPVGLLDPASRLMAARKAWNRFIQVSPFKPIGNFNHPASRVFTLFCWTEDLPNPGLVQSGIDVLNESHGMIRWHPEVRQGCGWLTVGVRSRKVQL